MYNTIGNNPTQNTAIADSAAERARSQLSGDFDTFLLMLTTQLQNQDPTEPMDTHQFTAQLVQFASVEQAIATNTNLEQLIGMQQRMDVTNAANYIGKFVEASGNSARLQGGVATFAYSLPEDAYEVEVVITDELGNIVYKGAGPNAKGKNEMLWDGTSNVTGEELAEGTYKINVVAKDARQESLEVTTYTTGFISSVDMEGGEIMLNIGTISLRPDQLKSLRDPLDFAS